VIINNVLYFGRLIDIRVQSIPAWSYSNWDSWAWVLIGFG